MKPRMKLNAAGWMAIVIVAVIVISGASLAGRALWVSVRGLDTLEPIEAKELEPAAAPPQPVASPTASPSPESEAAAGEEVEPTPDGWVMTMDDFTGDPYLAPPPNVEEQVRELFNLILSLTIIEDRTNEEALLYTPAHREDALARLEEVATPEIVQWYRERKLIVTLGELGPENPVRCESYHRCIVGRVKKQLVGGGIVYSEDLCKQLFDYYGEYGYDVEAEGVALLSGDGTYCVTRVVDDEHPRQVFVGVLDNAEGEGWKLVEFHEDPIN